MCSRAEERASVALTKGLQIAGEERETHHRKETQRDVMCGIKQIQHLTVGTRVHGIADYGNLTMQGFFFLKRSN